MQIEINQFIIIKHLKTIIMRKESEDQSSIKTSHKNTCIKPISPNLNHIIINLGKMYTIPLIMMQTNINISINIKDTPPLNIEGNSYQSDR